MTSYKITLPEELSEEQSSYLIQLQHSTKLLSEDNNQIFGIKDTRSIHLACSEAYAKIIGLPSKEDVSGRSDFDMPCEGTVEYAANFVEEDLSLINSKKINSVVSVLNIHHYSDGLKARIFKKSLLTHKPSQSIIGTMYFGQDIELKSILDIIPNYATRFSVSGSIQLLDGFDNKYRLSDYEQEICFLLLMNWEFSQIANFMNQFRPRSLIRTADTIIKKRNYICQKLGINSFLTKDLCEYLVSEGFHNKMPKSFYEGIIGSKVLGEESINI